jgi:sporulation protein YunB
MPMRRSVSRSVYEELKLQRLPRRKRRALVLIFLLVLLIAAAAGGLYLRAVTRDIAISDARDAVTLAVNACVSRMISENEYSYDYFVTLEKDELGNIAAIKTNTARINALSSRIMQEIAKAADSESLNIRIPLGSLLGSNLLMGRGPEIPVQVKMLTSSFVRFDNDLISTGINQSRHVITLIADVDIDIMIPLTTISTTVETDILIAETVIVGRVPETYVNFYGG